MSNVFDFLWMMVSTFVFVGFLIVLFQVVVDLFRDPELGGVAKALWIVALVAVPVLSSLVYIVARGRGMGERQRDSVKRAREQTETYIRDVAGKSPAEQIADAKKLLDEGTLTAEEYARLKAKALA
jgi:hypothetical protein